MDKITEMSYEALDRYFKSLHTFGYMPYNNVNKLISFLIIEELFRLYNDFITEEDFKIITKALYCLYGSTCMIDFPTCNYSPDIYPIIKDTNLRISESDIHRLSENSDIRIMS